LTGSTEVLCKLTALRAEHRLPHLRFQRLLDERRHVLLSLLTAEHLRSLHAILLELRTLHLLGVELTGVIVLLVERTEASLISKRGAGGELVGGSHTQRVLPDLFLRRGVPGNALTTVGGVFLPEIGLRAAHHLFEVRTRVLR